MDSGQWRIHARNIVTGVWLSRDVRMTDLSLTWTVSGSCEITGTINPDQPDYKDEKGQSIFQQWQTALFVESQDILRIGGIVSDLEYNGPEMTVTCVGYSNAIQSQVLWDSIVYGGATDGITGNGVDPMTVVKDIWAGIQSRERGDLGVTVTTPSSPYRLGTWHNAKNPADATDTNATDVDINRVWTGLDSKPPSFDTKTPVYWDYNLNWWDSVDAGGTIDNLAKQVPFDYVEHYDWVDANKSDVKIWIEVGYPRLGSKKTNLALVEGENVTEIIAIAGATDDYVNSIWCLGAGDGKDQVRGVVQIDDGRVKRSAVITYTSLTTKAACEAAARTELARRNKVENITAVSIVDHPNARVGSFSPGDDVRVRTHIGWNPQDLWCRVTSYQLDVATGVMTLTTARSDSFSYTAGSTT